MYKRFEVYDVALELATALRPTLEHVAKRDRDLASQLRRAMASVVLNLAEGQQRAGQDRMQLYRVSAGSAAEVKAALGLAAAWGYVDQGAFPAARELLERVTAMLWKLTNSRRA